MAAKRTYHVPHGNVITFNDNRTAIQPCGSVVREYLLSIPVSGFQTAWTTQATITMGFK